MVRNIKKKKKKNLYGFLSDFQLIFKTLKIYSNNVIQISLFLPIFSYIWQFLFGKASVRYYQKNKEMIKKSREWYQNLTEDNKWRTWSWVM